MRFENKIEFSFCQYFFNGTANFLEKINQFDSNDRLI